MCDLFHFFLTLCTGYQYQVLVPWLEIHMETLWLQRFTINLSIFFYVGRLYSCGGWIGYLFGVILYNIHFKACYKMNLTLYCYIRVPTRFGQKFPFFMIILQILVIFLFFLLLLGFLFFFRYQIWVHLFCFLYFS